MMKQFRWVYGVLLPCLLLIVLSTQAIAQNPPVEYIDRSSETQMQFTGQPRNGCSLNINNNAREDFILTRVTGNGAALGYTGYLISFHGAPQFTNTTTAFFPSGIAPTDGTTGVIPGDFNLDGFVDFFACDVNGGAHLYKNNGGNSFSDCTGSSGLATLMGNDTDVHNCSWADYDKDGFLDLTVVYGDPDYGHADLKVFHNNQGVFDTTVISHSPAGFSPLWADFDQDGDLDLLDLQSFPLAMGEPPSDSSFIFINQGNGTFVNEAGTRFDYDANYLGGDIALVTDYDNDGDLDVVTARYDGMVDVLENNTPTNPGLGYFHRHSLWSATTLDYPTDMAVFDFDLDGFQDILVGYGDLQNTQGNSTVFLLGNRPYGGSRHLVDESTSAGLTGTAYFAGMAPADFNRDGFTDIFLTRTSDQAFFYKAQAKSGETQNHWLGVHLNSPYGANSTNGLGATVVVTAGSSTYTQVVDGGSGYASMHEPSLVFGLGGYSGTVDVTVKWPAGRVQTVSGVSTGQYLTVVDNSPVVDNSTMSFTKVYHINSNLLDWVFTWEVFNDSPTSLDKVTFDVSGLPAQCLPPYNELTHQTPGVLISKNALGGVKYEHQLVLQNVACEAPCYIPYQDQSALTDYANTSDSRTAKIKTCVSSH